MSPKKKTNVNVPMRKLKVNGIARQGQKGVHFRVILE